MSLLDTASLIVTPNGYKEGKLYSVIPSDGSGDLSVTRATTATRVNSAGLVELVPYNLAQYSEQFDNAYWTKLNASITANATTAPNGSLTADKLVENTALNSHRFLSTAIETIASNQYTISIYLKAAERNYAYVRLNNSGGDIATANIDLVNGVVSQSVIGTFVVTSVGNGWFRVNGTGTSASSSNAYIEVRTSNSATYANYTGDGVSGIYTWGAQLNEGALKDYQKTATRLNIPRLDYSNGTCPSILVEPQRTNLLTYSSSFDNAAWNNSASVTANVIVSPSGIQDADRVTGILYQFISFTNGQSYTLSFYAKKNAQSSFVMRLDAPSNNSYSYNFDTETASSGATIESVGNGWYYCTASVTASFTGTGVFYANVNSNNFYLWGAQLEVGSYATSYIPTTSASVTRNADVISKTGISSLIGQTEGSVFWEGQISSTVGFPQLFDLNADGNKYIQIYNTLVSGVPRIGIYVQNVSVLLNNSNIATIAFDTNFKFALAYKNNDYVAYLNGVQVYSNTSTAVPPTSNFGLTAAGQGAETAGKNIKAAVLWKTRLTNTQLAQLTTI